MALAHSEIERFDDRWSAVMLVSGRDRPPPRSAELAGPAGLDWQRLGSRHAQDLLLFRTRYDEMRHPVSGRSFQRLVLESGDWVNCVATTDGVSVPSILRRDPPPSDAAALSTPGSKLLEGAMA